jgi:hypothetical protein
MARSTKLACSCGNPMNVIEVGAFWLEKLDSGKPYKLWSCDVVECKLCDNIVLLLGNAPYLAQHDIDFDKILTNRRLNHTVFEEKP